MSQQFTIQIPDAVLAAYTTDGMAPRLNVSDEILPKGLTENRMAFTMVLMTAMLVELTTAVDDMNHILHNNDLDDHDAMISFAQGVETASLASIALAMTAANRISRMEFNRATANTHGQWGYCTKHGANARHLLQPGCTDPTLSRI